MPHVAVHRETAELAAEMLALFGATAADEARARARISRDRGNVIHFCRWREAARLIRFLPVDHEGRTIH